MRVSATVSPSHQSKSIPLQILKIIIFLAPFYWLPFVSIYLYKIIRYGIIILFVSSVFIHYSLNREKTLQIPRNLSISLISAFPFILSIGFISTNDFIKSLNHYLNYLFPISFFFIMFYLIKDIKTIRTLVKICVAAMLIQAFYITFASYGIVPILQKPSIYGISYTPYSAGFFSAGTNFSISLALSVPLLLGIIFEKFQKRKIKKYFFLAFLLIPVAVAFSTCRARGGIIISVISVALFLFYYSKKYFIAYIFMILSSVMIIIKLNFQIFSEYFKMQVDLLTFFGGRETTFPLAIQMIKDNLLVGIGLGMTPFTLDNTYLTIILQCGIFVGLMTILIIGCIWAQAKRNMNYLKNSKYKILSISLYSAIFIFIANTIIESGAIFTNFFMSIPWWMCVVSIFVLPNLIKNND